MRSNKKVRLGSDPKERRSRRIRAGDVALVVLILVAAAASMVLVARATAGEKGSLAIVEVNGNEVRRITLGSDQPAKTITVKGWNGPSTFEVEAGRVRMVRSSCRDKICIGVGWIDTAGRSIVCLPNRVVIRITGSRKSGKIDTVTE
jgi:hypothetical protein